MKLVGTLALAVVSAALFLAAPASGYSTGSFSNAFATPDWKNARFSVSGTASPCGTGYCSYYPTVNAVPALPAYSNCREVALDSDPNTYPTWTGSSYTTNTSFSANVTNAPILNGVYGQRLCLVLVGQREVDNVVCEAQKKVLEDFYHEVLPPCDRIKVIFEEPVTSVLLSVEPPAAPAEPTPPVQAQPKAKAKGCPKGKRKVVSKGKTKCVKKKKKKAGK